MPSPQPTADELVTLPPVADADTTMPPSASVGADSPSAGVSESESIPGYEILAELGRGGMGVVYKARQTKLGRIVALKMILAGGHASEGQLSRFRTEAQSIARLQHTNIVQVHEIGEHDGRPFFSLEFCPGGSLDRKLNGTPLPPREAAKLVQALAGAMQAAHEANVVHRDLKPANVLLTDDGTPKVTDFGLAKLIDAQGQTQTGEVMGTPSYMAPEQAEGKRQIGPLADVYALGAILYELLTGRAPFKAATPLDTILQVLTDPPLAPRVLQKKISWDLETICLKCLDKAPVRRYSSAGNLAADLGRFLAGDPIHARRPSLLTRVRSWMRRPERMRDAGVAQILAWAVFALACIQAIVLALPVVRAMGTQEMIILGLALVLSWMGVRSGIGTMCCRIGPLCVGLLQWLLMVGGFAFALVAYGPTSSKHWNIFEVFNKNLGSVLVLDVSLIVLALYGVALHAYWVNRDNLPTNSAEWHPPLMRRLGLACRRALNCLRRHA